MEHRRRGGTTTLTTYTGTENNLAAEAEGHPQPGQAACGLSRRFLGYGSVLR